MSKWCSSSFVNIPNFTLIYKMNPSLPNFKCSSETRRSLISSLKQTNVYSRPTMLWCSQKKALDFVTTYIWFNVYFNGSRVVKIWQISSYLLCVYLGMCLSCIQNFVFVIFLEASQIIPLRFCLIFFLAYLQPLYASNASYRLWLP
jgi:hypothetical protein